MIIFSRTQASLKSVTTQLLVCVCVCNRTLQIFEWMDVLWPNFQASPLVGWEYLDMDTSSRMAARSTPQSWIGFLFFSYSWQNPVYWPKSRARILSHALFIHATTSTPAPTLIVLEKQFTPRLIVAWLFCANGGTFMYFNNQVIPASPHPHHFSFLYEQRWALFLHLPRYTREIKEGKELCNNQRGICLLSVIGKV